MPSAAGLGPFEPNGLRDDRAGEPFIPSLEYASELGAWAAYGDV
jgi:hypothetical protein